MDNPQFNIGDYVVCPGHGVGQVTNIESKDYGGQKNSFYIIKVITNGLTVMVPIGSKDQVRDLVTENEINDVFEILRSHDVEVDNSTWNRRHREYLNKINTGSLTEIADVLRSLFLLKTTKNLSDGERNLMKRCKELIVKEVSLAAGGQEKEIEQNIDSCFS